MKKYLLFFTSVFIILNLTGCTSKNRAYERTSLDIDWAFTSDVKDNINQSINDMASQLLQHSRISIQDNIAITAFVDLHQLNKTTHFGRKVSESFFNELHVRGFNVVDFRGTKNIRINADGEYFIARDIKLLHDKLIENSYILIGTYSRFGKGILLNARIIDNKSGKVLTTARSIIDVNACDIYENCEREVLKVEPKIEKVIQKRTIGLSDAGCSYVSCPKNCVTSDCYKNTISDNIYYEKKIDKIQKVEKFENKQCCVNTVPNTLHTH